jgi:hypothetical protein
MSTTTVVTVSRQALPSSPLFESISVTSTSNDFGSTLASSISGDLDDDVPSGMDKIHLIVKNSYKSRFHEVHAEQDLLLKRSQIYNEILSGNTHTLCIFQFTKIIL